ncbi:hypothetical protein MKW92_002219, partial [Papaver armeniacum]
MQGILDDYAGGWDKCWEQGVTPWDLDQPTPILLQLLENKTLPKGRVLVPGCGGCEFPIITLLFRNFIRGHDVIATANPEQYVVGLDISEIAITKARK